VITELSYVAQLVRKVKHFCRLNQEICCGQIVALECILFRVMSRSVVTGNDSSATEFAPEFTSTIYSYVKFFRFNFAGQKALMRV
jgi:hypothetical protein